LDQLQYNGKWVYWYNGGSKEDAFKATSGMVNFQEPKHQCVKDAGPVPPGKYFLLLNENKRDPFAKEDGKGQCNLKAGWGIQQIPRGGDATAKPSGGEAGECESYWANWGQNRVRIDPADAKTKTFCKPARSGFYLHDSIKGYSHGCIEVEGRFFTKLRTFAKKNPGKKMYITIAYTESSTNGGTKVP
jgi:hypothetical protein